MVHLFLVFVLGVVLGCRAGAADIFEANRGLGRGINLGNALEAPAEGDWGIKLEDSYFVAIQKAGFQHVRLPVRWSTHAAETTPYTIDPQFFSRVDWALDQALKRGLKVVLNVHHYEALYADPAAHQERFLALWRQIGAHYAERPDTIFFEALNEPHDQLDAERWNDLIPRALQVIRERNPQRPVVIGPANWNAVSALPRLKLPADDRRIIATFHYYEPFAFTHQGAEWVKDAPKLGTRWTGTAAETAALRQSFERAAEWAKRENRPLYVGEFGSYSKADLESRLQWTSAVRAEAENLGMSWAYWEFGAGFGAYDRSLKAWREPLLRALVPQ
ncbi:MAG TPA: glycoside hydrolase family 5 protein [Verrucomicrobiota bacterium]|nr:endoglucanase [Verrucomicrobiales bacterium]HRI14459.1 glycoside hydrolase family 5 protein [Verrucomicrobiota bacterium]